MNLPPPSERQCRIIWFALTGLAVAVLLGLLAGLVWGLGRVLDILSPVLWPLAVAGVIAYLLDPLVDVIERKWASRPRAIVCVFALALVSLAVLLGSVVPQLVTETRQLASRIPDYATQIELRIENWATHPPPWMQQLLKRESPAPATATANMPQSPPVSSTNLADSVLSAPPNNPPSLGEGIDKESLHTAAGWLAGALRTAASWFFGRIASWFGLLAGLALIPVYTFYFLLEKRGISSRWTNYLPVTDSNFKKELVFIISSINNFLIAFFRGQVLVSICDGILYALGFLMIQLPYAVLLGAAAIVLTIIPFLGAITICLAALVIALLHFGDWLHPLLVLAVFAVVQTLEALVISPKIMGDRVGLHPLTIIVAVMAGTTLLGGVLGGILAIPVTAVLRVLMFRYVWKRPSSHPSEA
jgi:predicted PurR-regulated permease PerM